MMSDARPSHAAIAGRRFSLRGRFDEGFSAILLRITSFLLGDTKLPLPLPMATPRRMVCRCRTHLRGSEDFTDGYRAYATMSARF